MNENIKKLLAKVEQSPELQAKFAQIRKPDEAYKLATSVQDGFTKDEFITEMKKLYDETVKDLSEEDLAKVAGGLDTEVAFSAAGSAAASAAVVLSLAAI